MKHLLFLLLFFTSANSWSQTSKVDFLLHKDWSYQNYWDTSYRIISTYDAACRLTTEFGQTWDNISKQWYNWTYNIKIYESGDHIAREIGLNWIDNSWDTSGIVVYTYDSSFKLLAQTDSLKYDTGWAVSLAIFYTYDINGYYDSILIKSDLGGPYGNYLLELYYYKKDGTLDSMENKRWNSLTSSWEHNWKDTYTYNTDKTLHQTVEKAWYDTAWENLTRLTYSYNSAGKILTILNEQGVEEGWANSSLTTTTYDSKNLPVDSLYQNWGLSGWTNFIHFTSIYDGLGNLLSRTEQQWYEEASVWYNQSRDNYAYTNCTLPLNLITFTAERDDNFVSLNWKTTNEINMASFDVQRSLNGTTFFHIGNVAAKSNGSLVNYYDFRDDIEKITADKVYYRLQMTDEDGSYSYSKIIPLNLNNYAAKLKVYPNPVNDRLQVLFNIQNSTKVNVRITDAAGKIVYNDEMITTPYDNSITINVSGLPKGIYYLQLVNGKDIRKTQFVK